MGHNSEVNAMALRAYVERAERLHEQRDELAADLSELFKEARGNGFDSKALRKVISLRRMDRDKRIQEQAMVDLYWNSIGEGE